MSDKKEPPPPAPPPRPAPPPAAPSSQGENVWVGVPDFKDVIKRSHDSEGVTILKK